MVEGVSTQNKCPECGEYLDLIDDDDTWFCRSCNKYIDVHDKIDSKGMQPSVVSSSSNSFSERCSICLGSIADENQVFECECANISHEDCAKRVGKCSFCGKDYTPEEFLESKDFFKLIEKGKSAFNEARYDKAISWYKRALKVRANSVFAINCIGMAYAENGQFKDAMSCYDNALEMRKSHEAYYNKAVVLLKMKMYEDTLKSINEAISLNRHDARSWYVKGLALSRMNMNRVGIKCYDMALDLIPENHLFWYAKAKALMKLDRLDEALECYETSLEINPKDIKVLYEKGRLLSIKNRVDEAILTFDEVLKWEPEHTGAKREKEKVLARG